MPYPDEQKGKEKDLWTTTMNRSKQAGMSTKTVVDAQWSQARRSPRGATDEV
jgi:hypothetical protein